MIAKSLGWKPGAATDGGSLGNDTGGDKGSTEGVLTGTGVSVSTMSAPQGDTGDDLNTIHGLAISGDAQKLEKMVEATSLDINQRDKFVGVFTTHVSQARD